MNLRSQVELCSPVPTATRSSHPAARRRAAAAHQLRQLPRHDLALELDGKHGHLLRRAGRDGQAERGLLIQSAAYTVARTGDQTGMRELAAEAAAIARQLGGTT
ncbi:hypothetical protein [Streptomyces sp. NPDC059003]|uniref:hypothetical protein n=1 Tax=Streptomyces sp. NPDC059003 TaxID=3346691 RepID=UPI0036C736B3